jgi:Lysozyme-like
MKRRRKKFRTLFVLLVFSFAFFIIYHLMSDTVTKMKSDPFADVKKYQPLIHDELEKYHLENYTTVLIALMQQESHGHGGDPMQASESAGLARNTIQDPKQSIQVGVKHFQRTFFYGKQRKVDFPTILQAYNMGVGYIDYVAQHGGKHSEQLAKRFSLLQVKRKPTIYTCGGDKNNFRYPYCYGDFTYSSKVSKNIQSLAESIPASSQKTSGESF